MLLLTLSLLCAAVSSATTSSSANLYLYPAAPGKGRAIEISSAQANQVLAHLLNVPGETLGAGAGHRDAWDWIVPASNGREAVQDLFDDSRQRKVILITDLNSQEAQGMLLSIHRFTPSLTSVIFFPPVRSIPQSASPDAQHSLTAALIVL